MPEQAKGNHHNSKKNSLVCYLKYQTPKKYSNKQIVLLKLLKHKDIDKAKWDDCISNAANGRIYALSWYLDIMCPTWSAIVTEDYQFIMPLPVRKKWGITYIFQPAFTQQLGIFSKENCSEHVVEKFVQEVKRNFNYAEINFNSQNVLDANIPHKIKKNYLLPLDSTYENLQKGYSGSARRNISKAIKNNILIEESNDCSTLLDLHSERYANTVSNKEDLFRLAKLLQKAALNEMAQFFYAKNAAGKFIASSGYLIFKDRIIFLVNGNIKEGLKSGATHLLKNYAIKKFSDQGLMMDFEGSETPSFAGFYEQYGAKNLDAYSFYKHNELPFPINLFKK